MSVLNDPNAKRWTLVSKEPMRQCFCIGPQPGHKLCPCMEAADAHRRAHEAAPYIRRIAELEAENERLKKRRPRKRPHPAGADEG